LSRGDILGMLYIASARYLIKFVHTAREATVKSLALATLGLALFLVTGAVCAKAQASSRPRYPNTAIEPLRTQLPIVQSHATDIPTFRTAQLSCHTCDSSDSNGDNAAPANYVPCDNHGQFIGVCCPSTTPFYCDGMEHKSCVKDTSSCYGGTIYGCGYRIHRCSRP
jgi:hypothetical protein